MRRPVLVSVVAALFVLFAGAGIPAAAEAEAGGPPAFLGAAAATVPDPFTGTVVELLDVDGYAYARVRTPAGQTRWTVSLGAGHPVGTVVEVVPFGALDDFRSRRAQRRFDHLIFASLRPRSLR